MKYTVQQRVIDGELVDVKVYAARPTRIKQVVRVGGRYGASGGLAIAQQSSQILRCNKCSTKITREDEKWGGVCSRH